LFQVKQPSSTAVLRQRGAQKLGPAVRLQGRRRWATRTIDVSQGVTNTKTLSNFTKCLMSVGNMRQSLEAQSGK